MVSSGADRKSKAAGKRSYFAPYEHICQSYCDENVAFIVRNRRRRRRHHQLHQISSSAFHQSYHDHHHHCSHEAFFQQPPPSPQCGSYAYKANRLPTKRNCHMYAGEQPLSSFPAGGTYGVYHKKCRNEDSDVCRVGLSTSDVFDT